MYALLVFSSVYVLQDEIARRSSSCISTSYGAVSCLCHPLNSEIGIEASFAVELHVEI